jgi:hypothetical protein
VARTPEASAVKKRKSLFMNVVQSSRDDFRSLKEGDQGGVTYDKILPERGEVVLTPVPISKRERNEMSTSFGKKLRDDNVKEINRGSVNIFEDFAISSVELGMNNCEDLLISNKNRSCQMTNVAVPSIQENREVAESSSSMEVDEIGSISDGSSAAPGNKLSTLKIVLRAASPYECENDNNSVESDLDQLNIDEILQAFRDDAKAAERAIEMATICGRLHPKEFREYLRAFRSPPAKDLQRITESLTLQGSLERVERNKDTVWDISRTQSALLVSSSDQNNLLPICHRLGQQSYPSPKSSLLHFLEMADTPVAVPPSEDISSNIVNVDFASSEPEVKSVICEVKFSAAKSAKINVVEVKHLSIKDRADEVRIVVAAAVASVLNIPLPQTTPSSTLPTQPIALSVVQTQLPEVAESLRRCSEDNFSQMKEEEGFHPKKVIMRTPPKVIEDAVAATSTPIPSVVKISSDPIPEITVATVSNDFLENTVIAENESVAQLTESSPKGFSEINEEISRKICEESSNMSVAIPTTSTYNDEWSVLELDRVDSVIRRVSMSVPDCPSAHTVMGQLKVSLLECH